MENEDNKFQEFLRVFLVLGSEVCSYLDAELSYLLQYLYTFEIYIKVFQIGFRYSSAEPDEKPEPYPSSLFLPASENVKHGQGFDCWDSRWHRPGQEICIGIEGRAFT